jgi:hypothetical protein
VIIRPTVIDICRRLPDPLKPSGKHYCGTLPARMEAGTNGAARFRALRCSRRRYCLRDEHPLLTLFSVAAWTPLALSEIWSIP